LSHEAQTVLRQATIEADLLDHRYVGTEHLLLALLQLGTPVTVGDLSLPVIREMVAARTS
jgi:hypothetical protein